MRILRGFNKKDLIEFRVQIEIWNSFSASLMTQSSSLNQSIKLLALNLPYL